jgi:hypothetical protein
MKSVPINRIFPCTKHRTVFAVALPQIFPTSPIFPLQQFPLNR